MGDAFARHLRALGYNALAMPTGRFKPLALVYEHDGNRGWSADFPYLVQEATVAPPVPDQATLEPGLSGKVLGNLDVSGTISILNGLISALGGGTLGLKGGFDRAATVTFRYGEVTMSGVSEAALDRYVKSGHADRQTVPGRYLGDHLYVATRVLRSRSFEVSAQDARGRSIGLDLPVISGAVGAAISVKWSTKSEATIAFDGDIDMTFAFQAFRILERDGRMRVFPTRAGDVRVNDYHAKIAIDLDGNPMGGLPPVDPVPVTEMLLIGERDPSITLIGGDEDPIAFDSSAMPRG